MIFGNKIINKIPKILDNFFKYLDRILNIFLTHLEFIGLLTWKYLNLYYIYLNLFIKFNYSSNNRIYFLIKLIINVLIE